LFAEKKSYANYFIKKANIDKDKFLSFVQKEYANTEDEEGTVPPRSNPQLERLISQFCINLSARAKAKKIDPVIGRDEELENIHLSLPLLLFEQSCRFLGDFLINDPYYSTQYELQNLVRTKTQLKLLEQVGAYFKL
jgi:hypothetical protein